MKFIFIVWLSLLNCLSANCTLQAAEKININFEEMSIPVSVDQLSKLVNKEDSTEVIDWFKNNGLKKIIELSKFLKFPILKQEGFSNQFLRSWIGRKVLSELSNIIIIPNDQKGIQLFNTIENLLESKNEISTLDIIKSIPIKEINLDIDKLIMVVSSWKSELERQQKLVNKLNLISNVEKNFTLNSKDYIEYEIKTFKKYIYAPHRDENLLLEIWEPLTKNKNKDLIIFMPGLGGNFSNFRWLSKELSRKGWPVIFIDHPGSNSEALKASFEGKEALPGGADIYLYRLKDLDLIINANRNGYFGFEQDSYILMGHSLGSLVSFLYEGNLPLPNFESRCDNALKDFALTNLSKLLQCQLSEIPIPQFKKKSSLKALIGFNSFGSLIWPDLKSSGIESPILLIGGTYDLITPLVGEQFKMFLANETNKFNRFLIVEGASHFSAIRIINKNQDKKNTEDIFKINETFIGTYPEAVQNLSLNVIIKFLRNLDNGNELKIMKKQKAFNLNFHILGEREIKRMNIN